MANLPGHAFAKGRDRLVRIADPAGVRQSCTVANRKIIIPDKLAKSFLKGATQAEFTPSPNSKEFFLLGDDGWRDSVGVTQAGELSCTAFLINNLSNESKPEADIDAALAMVLDAESNPDREIWVEVFTFLGTDSADKYQYHCRAFQACVTNVRESAPSDGLIEYSWTFQSRGEVWAGLHEETTALTVY